MSRPITDRSTDFTLEYLSRLAQAYLACGEQTAEVEFLLRRCAAAYGMRRPRAVVFPTTVLLGFDDGESERSYFAEGPTQTLRLDQIADVYELGEATQAGTVPPREGLQRLSAILRKQPRFGLLGMILGHTILVTGVAMLFMPTATNLAAAAILGTMVGMLKVLNRNRPVLAVPLPIVAAFAVAVTVFFAIEHGLPVEPLHSLVPPLITFLPGAMLTMGMVELAYGDMVSGSSRLVTGFVQLVLLVGGLAAGAMLVGYQPADLVEATPEDLNPAWVMLAPWLGAAVFGVGAFLHFSAPRQSFGWLLLVLLMVFGTQQLAMEFIGRGPSAFLGMLVATPLAFHVQLRFKGPPAMVTLLPSFWLLVPGALGLVSVKHMLSDRVAGLDGLVTAVFVFASIAVGSLLGASLYKTIAERFGWRRIQNSRVGRMFRGRMRR